MSRIAPIDVTTATGDAAAQLAAARKLFGTIPNLAATAAHSPPTLAAMLSLFSNLGRTPVGGRTGELIAIAVAQANGCGYCLSAHSPIGAKLGLSADALSAARQAQATDSRTVAILALPVYLNRSRGHVSDAALAAVRLAGLSDAEIVAIVGHVALNVFTNYLNSVAGTAIDFPSVPLDAAA